VGRVVKVYGPTGTVQTSLGGGHSDDMNVFYAFCRLVDDLADEPEPSVEERRAALQRWREAVSAPVPDESPLAPAVRELIAKYQLSTDHFSEIIAGCEMDLDGTRYATWDDLRVYCYRVASVVGLVSIEIFGYEDPRCRRYAVDLGLALQLTNILRDVGMKDDKGKVVTHRGVFKYDVDGFLILCYNQVPTEKRPKEFKTGRTPELASFVLYVLKRD